MRTTQLKKTIYLDMDGVVADFNAYARSVCKTEVIGDRWPEQEWTRLKDNPRLYKDLAKTSEADELVYFCKKVSVSHDYDLKFLTAVPKNNDMFWSFYDKVIWVQKHYGDIPVMFGPYSTDKHLHYKAGDILIDDRTSNINEWRSVGGVAILHKGDIRATIASIELAINGEHNGME